MLWSHWKVILFLGTVMFAAFVAFFAYPSISNSAVNEDLLVPLDTLPEASVSTDTVGARPPLVISRPPSSEGHSDDEEKITKDLKPEAKALTPRYELLIPVDSVVVEDEQEQEDAKKSEIPGETTTPKPPVVGALSPASAVQEHLGMTKEKAKSRKRKKSEGLVEKHEPVGKPKEEEDGGFQPRRAKTQSIAILDQTTIGNSADGLTASRASFCLPFVQRVAQHNPEEPDCTRLHLYHSCTRLGAGKQGRVYTCEGPDNVTVVIKHSNRKRDNMARNEVLVGCLLGYMYIPS